MMPLTLLICHSQEHRQLLPALFINPRSLETDGNPVVTSPPHQINMLDAYLLYESIHVMRWVLCHTYCSGPLFANSGGGGRAVRTNLLISPEFKKRGIHGFLQTPSHYIEKYSCIPRKTRRDEEKEKKVKEWGGGEEKGKACLLLSFFALVVHLMSGYTCIRCPPTLPTSRAFPLPRRRPYHFFLTPWWYHVVYIYISTVTSCHYH